MFASKLLQVLQTLATADARNAFDSDELEITMKENPEKYADPFASENNDEKDILRRGVCWNTSELESIVVHNLLCSDETAAVRKLPGSVEKCSDFCTVKNVAECELPELICYEDSSFPVIKDICVDEGVHSANNILFSNGSVHNLEVIEAAKDSKQTEDVYTDANETGSSKELSSDGMPPVKESHRACQSSVEGISDRPGIVLSAGNADAVTVNWGGEKSHCLPVPSQNVLSHQKEDSSDGYSMTNNMQCGEGETSFSVLDPVLGQRTYSNSTAFSGSISHRSDSSTTSTRSFAFPILQTEGNDSPVRMVNGDRRRTKKPQRRTNCFLCCKF